MRKRIDTFAQRSNWRRSSGRNEPAVVFRYSFLARNLSMQGRFDEAEAVLASVPNIDPVRGQTKADPMSYAKEPLLARAMVKLDRGEPAAALALLPPDQADIEDFPFEHRQPAARRGSVRTGKGSAKDCR